MRRISSLLLAAGLLTSSVASVSLAAPKKKPAKVVKKKKAPPKRVPPVSAAAKAKLALNMGQFKWGMTKDQVLATLQKDLDARFEDKIKATSDIPTQDRLRRQKKIELNRIAKTYTSFEGKRTGWDVSIIEEEFRHKTGESMLERWENQDGKNNRRFFFFHEGKLYKMFIQLDVSILPEDKRNFDTFKGVMQSNYGAGAVEADRITWRTPEFTVRALDKLKAYGAVAIAIEHPRVVQDLVAIREAAAPPKKETSPVIKAIIDDGSSTPDVKNNTAVEGVIKSHKK